MGNSRADKKEAAAAGSRQVRERILKVKYHKQPATEGQSLNWGCTRGTRRDLDKTVYR